MRARLHKVLRDISDYRTRTALVVASIALGVIAVGAITQTRLVLDRELDAAYLATDPADATLALTPFDEAFVDAIESRPDVAAAEGRRLVTVQLETAPDEWVDLDLTTIPDFDAQSVDRVVPEDGAWPPTEGTLVVERSALDLLEGAGFGDTLTVRTSDEREHELRLAGTAYAAGAPPAFALGYPSGYIDTDTLETLGYGRTYDELLLRTSTGQETEPQVLAVADDVADQARSAGLEVDYVTVNVPLEHPAQTSSDTVLMILLILGLLTLAASAFLVWNTVSAVLSAQTRQIGVMKAIGASNGQLMALYAALVVGYGLLAVAVAVPLGALLANALIGYTAGLLNLDPSLSAPPPVVIGLQLVIGITVPLLAALPPVVRGIRISVREAISSAGISSTFGLDRVDRVVASIRFLPRAARLALRNATRQRARLAITVASLTLGGAVFMAVISLQTSLGTTLDRSLEFFGFDVQTSVTAPARAEALVAAAERLPETEAAEPWLVQPAQLERPDGSTSAAYTTFGTPAGSVTLQPDVTTGRWLLPDDANALVITDNLLEDEPDLSVGSVVPLSIADRTTDWTVVGVIEAPTPQQAMYTNLGPLAEASGLPGRANALVLTTTSHDRATQDDAAAALRDELAVSGITVGSSLTTGYIREQQTLLFGVLVSFLAVMALLVGAVGGIGLSGTMSLSVAERAREIGVLRAIGASNQATRHIFLVEGLAIGLVSWAAGALVALPISFFMSNLIGIAFVNRPLDFAFAIAGVGLWLVIVVVISILATLAPAASAARLTVREALAYE
jgi:putative ABC transport system permease protein